MSKIEEVAYYSAAYGLYEKLEVVVLLFTAILFNYIRDMEQNEIKVMFSILKIICPSEYSYFYFAEKYLKAEMLFFIMGIGTFFKFMMNRLLLIKKDYINVVAAYGKF